MILDSNKRFSYRHPIRTSSEVLFLLLQIAYYASARCSYHHIQLHYFNILHYFKLLQYCDLLISSLWSSLYSAPGPSSYNELLYYVVIMSYYNQPLPGLGKAKAIVKFTYNEKMHTNTKNGIGEFKNGAPN